MTIYYIKSTGSDANTGLSDAQAWQTLTKVNATAFAAGDQVLFNKGDSWFGTLNVRAGSSGNPTIYGAYGTGAKPIITGFQTITGWSNIGDAAGVWHVIISPTSPVQIVSIDSIHHGMGRYPSSSYLTWDSAVTNVSITDDLGFGADNWVDAEIVLFKNGFTIDRCSVDSQVSNTISYTSLGTTRTADATGNYFFQNSLQTLNYYGAWHYDSESGKLSVYFGEDVDPTTKTTKVAINDYVIYDASARDNITIDGLTIEGSNKSAIKFGSGSNNITVQNCTIRFAGASAIEVPATVENPSDNGIFSYNTISDCAQGIDQDGDNALISHNTITRIGSVAGVAYQAVNTMAIVTNGDNGIIEYNEITLTGYSGIYANTGAINTKIRYNHISETCQLLHDAGGIYLGHVHTGSEITDNTVHDLNGNGIYMDEYCEGVTTSGNTVFGCYGNGIFLHKAHNNTVSDNLCFDNFNALQISNWDNADNVHDNIITGNYLIAKTAIQYTLGWINRYSGAVDIGTMNSNYYCRPIAETDSFKVDVVDAFPGSHNFTFAEWQSMSAQDANSHQSPKSITSEDELYFVYNETNAAKQVLNPTTAIDMNGLQYPTAFELQPYTSRVLIKDLTESNPTGANILLVAPNGKYYKNSVTGKFLVKQ